VEAYSNVSIKTQLRELTECSSKKETMSKKANCSSLDKRPLESDLKKAEGMLAKISAGCQAQPSARRYEALLASGLVSRQEYDQIRPMPMLKMRRFAPTKLRGERARPDSVLLRFIRPSMDTPVADDHRAHDQSQ